ncbi:AAA family ATPase [Dactylosporangium sp. McL0621]|uniref:AAA family ATPase n=1 Tax=Dactylosporangium sp. McL0621 TaxID=3415678 RepID=UPI003CF3B78D
MEILPVVDAKSSSSIRPNVSGERHQSRQPRLSLPVVELLGRAEELELIDASLIGCSRVGAGLLLYGDPGIGKSALLDVAAARAETAGMRVLRASGVEFEAGIGLSVVHQLIYPIRAWIDRLAAGHGDVLRQVLDLPQRTALDPVLVSTAVLALLGEVAAGRPLLLVVDDVQWIDRGSATVLGFAARRIGSDPIMLLAAARSGASSLLHQVGLPEREIGPLADQPAAALLDAWHPGLAPASRRRLVAEAAGNPLALRELPASLTDAQRSGKEPLPTFLPLSRRLEAVFAAGAPALPAPTRQLLLLAALDADAGPGTIRAALQSIAPDPADVGDLAPARRADLVHADACPGRMSFRHPLIRSAIVQATPPDERRSAHLALAAALTDDPGRRAWHLAEAATGPDESVARALEDAALCPQLGCNGSATVTRLVRAAELSPQPADRSRRLIEAAYLANSTEQLDQVTRLLTDAKQAGGDAGQAPDPRTGSAFAAATATYLMHGEGDVDAAHRLLARALDDADTAETGSDWVNAMLDALLFVCVYADQPEPWQHLGRALARFSSEGTTHLRLCYDALTDPGRVTYSVRKRLADALVALPADPPPWQLIPMAYAALMLDMLAPLRQLLRRMIERERDSGGTGLVISGLLLLSGDSYNHGHWDEVEDLARQGLDLATTHGYHLLAGQLRGHLAIIAALRGDAELARTLSDEITTWAAPRGVGTTQTFARYARAFAAMGEGDYEAAYVQSSHLSSRGRTSPGLGSSWMVLDLVEAAVRTGHSDEARAWVAAAQQAGEDRISARTALITAGAAALAAHDDDAGGLFEAALSLPETDRQPFEQARIHLAYGEWLRRTRDTTQARLHLRAALETLDRLGARPWAQRARNELRATGIPTTARPDARGAALTTQERQIATLAATGLTNKQIGQRLFLSHRTVSAHLHRLFPKLGITTRAALRDALETITSDGHVPRPRRP